VRHPVVTNIMKKDIIPKQVVLLRLVI